MKNSERILYTEWRIEKQHCVHNEELRNDIERNIKYCSWYIIQNEELRNDIVYTMKNWEMILNTQWRTGKWYSIHNEKLRNDMVYTMKNWEMILSGI